MTLKSTWHGVMVEEEKFSRWKILIGVYVKTHTKYAESICGKPTLKGEVQSAKT